MSIAMTKQIIIGIDASRGNTLNRTGVEEYVFQLIQEIKNIHTKASVFPETTNCTKLRTSGHPDVLLCKLTMNKSNDHSRIVNSYLLIVY